jgi:hypothetical protein
LASGLRQRDEDNQAGSPEDGPLIMHWVSLRAARHLRKT